VNFGDELSWYFQRAWCSSKTVVGLRGNKEAGVGGAGLLSCPHPLVASIWEPKERKERGVFIKVGVFVQSCVCGFRLFPRRVVVRWRWSGGSTGSVGSPPAGRALPRRPSP
jgi:hypothetical protein